MMAPKLTKAQFATLQDAARISDGVRCANNYKPAQALFALGLVSVVPQRFGSHRYVITDAGRAALFALAAL